MTGAIISRLRIRTYVQYIQNEVSRSRSIISTSASVEFTSSVRFVISATRGDLSCRVLLSDCSIEEKSEAKHTGYVYTREHWFLSIFLQKEQN